jgi:hypothetical protein
MSLASPLRSFHRHAPKNRRECAKYCDTYCDTNRAKEVVKYNKNNTLISMSIQANQTNKLIVPCALVNSVTKLED